MIIRDITERRATEVESERLLHDLKEALGRIKSLSGLLPRCASRRKIRDQKGSWHDLETYIGSHTEADLVAEVARIAGGSSTLRPFAADAT
jgi:hypothetical protein